MTPITTHNGDDIIIQYGWLRGTVSWCETLCQWSVAGGRSGSIPHIGQVVDTPEVKRSEAYASACIRNEIKQIAGTLSDERRGALEAVHAQTVKI